MRVVQNKIQNRHHCPTEGYPCTTLRFRHRHSVVENNERKTHEKESELWTKSKMQRQRQCRVLSRSRKRNEEYTDTRKEKQSPYNPNVPAEPHTDETLVCSTGLRYAIVLCSRETIPHNTWACWSSFVPFWRCVNANAHQRTPTRCVHGWCQESAISQMSMLEIGILLGIYPTLSNKINSCAHFTTLVFDIMAGLG